MPTLQANGINLFYDLEGTGEPLLLISGFGCDHSYWSLIMPSLVSHYQVIGLDNRGSGQSSTPPGPYSIKQMATDVALLLEHLGLAQVQVVGHSMGGQIAQELALSFPSKVRSLALLASWARGDARFNTVIETFGELPRSVKLNLYQKVVLPWMYAEDFFSTAGEIEQIINLWSEYPFAPTPQGLYHHSQAILNSDTSARLGEIQCPTLVLAGRQDILAPIKHSEQLARGIANAELVVLDRGGHGLVIESPEAVVSILLKFLAQNA